MVWTDFANPSEDEPHNYRNKAEALRTSRKQASKEQLKNMSKAARDEVHVAVAQPTEMSSVERDEVCSMKQRWSFNGIRGIVTSLFKNIMREFGAICQKCSE